MASRPLEMPPGCLAARSPVRQNVALRWVNSVAPVSDASKTAFSPVKRWPPPSKVEAPPHASVVATPMPAPATEKKPVSAGFQSARAVFEAKKATAAATTTPQPPPIRRRLPFPAPPASAVVKQHLAASNLSSSSCSMVDSESNRKLEESMEAQHAFKTRSPVRPSEAKKVEKESVVTTPPVAANVSAYPAVSVPRSPVPIKQAPRSHKPELIMKQGQPDSIDPFQLLLPVQAVPTLPDDVAYVYDNAAIEMQKGIKKVVRKLLNKNKARQLEFKVNSRLFGTDFMDSHAYLDTLIKDFGAIRALQLVPCVLSIQPDILKTKALLLTAKNYLLRNEEILKCELRALQESRDNAKTDDVSIVSSVPAPLTVAAAVKSLSPVIKAALKVPSAPVAFAPAAGLQLRKDVNPTASTAQTTTCVSVPECVDTTVSKNVSAELPISAPEVITPVAILAEKGPEFTRPTEGVAAVTVNDISHSAEPMPEPQATVALPHVINIAVSTRSPTPTTTPVVYGIDANLVVKKRSESGTPSNSEGEFRAENLFGEPINLASPKKQQQQQVNADEAATSPMSSTHSFDEAESLFGERLSSSSRSSTGRRKTVTWGETKTVEVSVERASPVKKKPAPLIFGLATAGAFDSDSDESDF